MEFNPNNPIVRLCLQAMALEAQGQKEQAEKLYEQAWQEGQTEHDQFLAAYYMTRIQTDSVEKLIWLKKAIELAETINDASVKSAFPNLYATLSEIHHALGNEKEEQEAKELALMANMEIVDHGPFYHGTRADLKIGDLLVPGGSSNYQENLTMNHIYFTAMINGAGLAAALAKGNGPERVYRIEATGTFENDPNVTDKKFPGNPTRSYRSLSPLKIVGEEKEWLRQTPEEIQKWKERLAKSSGEIIN